MDFIVLGLLLVGGFFLGWWLGIAGYLKAGRLQARGVALERQVAALTQGQAVAAPAVVASFTPAVETQTETPAEAPAEASAGAAAPGSPWAGAQGSEPGA